MEEKFGESLSQPSTASGVSASSTTTQTNELDPDSPTQKRKRVAQGFLSSALLSVLFVWLTTALAFPFSALWQLLNFGNPDQLVDWQIHLAAITVVVLSAILIKARQETGERVLIAIIAVLLLTAGTGFTHLGEAPFWSAKFAQAVILFCGIGLWLIFGTARDLAKEKTYLAHRKDLQCVGVENSLKSPGKTIVICIDGTGDLANDTNVSVIHEYVSSFADQEMISVYIPGVGTIANGALERSTDMALGTSLDRTVTDAYRFLVKNYESGDRILMFGFSRGAFGVRVLAGFICVYGIMLPGYEHMISAIWQNHKNPNSNADKDVIKNLKNSFPTRDGIAIDYIGLWDTVSAIGFLRQRNFPFTRSLPNAIAVRHAVADKEMRNMFPVNRISTDNPAHEEKCFDGDHRCIGGGKGVRTASTIRAFDWIVSGHKTTAGAVGRLKNTNPYTPDPWMVRLYGILGLIPQRGFYITKDGKEKRLWEYFKFTSKRDCPKDSY